MKTLPICVDLDGTLIHTDMLHESALGLLKVQPLYLFKLPWVLIFKGKAALKQWLADKTQFDACVLPYNQDFLIWLREQHTSGRKLVLCTASDRFIADAIAQHLGLFDEVMASNGTVNLEGRHKANALVEKFGDKGFDYAGNSIPDLEVWKHARKAIVVNASSRLVSDVIVIADVEAVFMGGTSKFTVWAKALRLHQWLKNGLLLVPLLAAHQLTDSAAWLSLLWAFVAFSLCASTVYIANDLLDLESDRQHPSKCKRPFASGALDRKSNV
jgi:phosphoserine phosphatase